MLLALTLSLHSACHFKKPLKKTDVVRNVDMANPITSLDVVVRQDVVVFVDALFGVHLDFTNQTGGAMTYKCGTPITVSRKQKLNTRSSTEAELVGADDIVPLAMWMCMFVEAQGYETEVIIFQDNESAILLEINGMQHSVLFHQGLQ